MRTRKAGSELQEKAKEAWKAMLHDLHPMPAGVAIDMVQDVCGDRFEAVAMLFAVAAKWLRAAMPKRNQSAGAVCESIARGNLGLAEERILYAPIHRPEWRQWSYDAPRAVQMCREIDWAV